MSSRLNSQRIKSIPRMHRIKASAKCIVCQAFWAKCSIRCVVYCSTRTFIKDMKKVHIQKKIYLTQDTNETHCLFPDNKCVPLRGAPICSPLTDPCCITITLYNLGFTCTSDGQAAIRSRRNPLTDPIDTGLHLHFQNEWVHYGHLCL